jgi:DNA integrity scanning protein DisA with diadenylate cyclase activity
VRAVGGFGVVRWDSISWHHEPPVTAWVDTLTDGHDRRESAALAKLLEFAVHDLGSRGIGALLVHRPASDQVPFAEIRLPAPPALQIDRPADLAPLRHVLAQIDGAAVFDELGTLRHLGVRLVPSPEAEADVEGYRGMRHTSARRYSFDDPDATVIVVSEDGPVTVVRHGRVLARPTPT